MLKYFSKITKLHIKTVTIDLPETLAETTNLKGFHPNSKLSVNGPNFLELTSISFTDKSILPDKIKYNEVHIYLHYKSL